MPGTTQPSSQDWIALGPASRLLGVDPDTLRRWADDGRVEAWLTPGGHRRFDREALERMVAARRSRPARSSLARLGATPERLSRAYRRSSGTGAAAALPATLDAPDRAALRDDGRRLVELLVRHVDADQPEARRRAEEEAGELTEEVGRRLAASGTGLTDAVARFVAARRPLLAEIGTLAARRTVDPATLSTIQLATSDLLDRLLVRLVAAHQAAHPAAERVATAGAAADEATADRAARERAAADRTPRVGGAPARSRIDR